MVMDITDPNRISEFRLPIPDQDAEAFISEAIAGYVCVCVCVCVCRICIYI